jgi:hypothetical protein
MNPNYGDVNTSEEILPSNETNDSDTKETTHDETLSFKSNNHEENLHDEPVFEAKSQLERREFLFG